MTDATAAPLFPSVANMNLTSGCFSYQASILVAAGPSIVPTGTRGGRTPGGLPLGSGVRPAEGVNQGAEQRDDSGPETRIA